jgi:hypothetical protein
MLNNSLVNEANSSREGFFMISDLFDSADKLYKFIFEHFWDGHRVVGPDPGLMLNLRALRFIKSYIPSLSQAGHNYFLQTQGYWIKDNWDLYRLTDKSTYEEVAIACSDHVIISQRDDGSWEYPLREWQKYVSTVEGTWAALGLLESFRQTKNQVYLKAALKWYEFLINKTKFQKYHDSLAVNYFAFSSKGKKVPNNTTLVIWFFAELFEITKDRKFNEFSDSLIRFLELCQKSDGELIYEVGTDHYLCYHYNSFEFLDLLNNYNLTCNLRIKLILSKLAKFIASGVTENGGVKYSCSQTYPELIWFSSVAGAALIGATTIGLGNYQNHIKHLYRYVLENQRDNGSFFFSRHDMLYLKKPVQWGFLTDRTSYPRQLSYILQHLLIGINSKTTLN